MSWLLGIIVMGSVVSTTAFDENNWVDYPAYCSKHVEKNIIKELPSSDHYKLDQVQIAIRHGARTLVGRSMCWDGYNATWNCNARNHIEPSLEMSTHRSFDVKYTPGETVLKGTCQVGQLLDEGYRQETLNGENFYRAYIASNRLYQSTEQIDLTNDSDIYLSSTDMQRTVMSGQLVVDAMFPKTKSASSLVSWHVGDISQSSFVPNPFACPRLGEIKRDFEASDEYQLWLRQHDALVETIKKTFHSYDPKGLFDCLLTARCSLTHTDIPASVTPQLYNDIIRFERDKRMKIYTEDPIYAKLSVSKLLRWVRSRMLASTPPRFVLYSGHDDTVMPILAALGGELWLKDWPPYAAFLAFELYTEISTHKRFVRVIYQGQTLSLEGCDNESLCPLDLFLKWTEFAETSQCDLHQINIASKTEVPKVEEEDDDFSLTTHVSFETFLLCVIVGVLLGFVFGLLVANAARQNSTDQDKISKPKSLEIKSNDEDENGELLPPTSEPSSPTVEMAFKMK
ncbi:hypothetical protein THRCLA_05196 [Thraustotheca clavata]|uniref:Uncharacterized protein n=1 Tax=Thraustotheca clavata TaxID=74557 RepID=A0A1V9ZWR7_9STRA|nr:hypothetical protein THRCLA_05196 [Thraustotheca clavata]